jgi:hypothetical protein
MSWDLPSKEEIEYAVLHLKRNKTAGLVDCCDGAFKADNTHVVISEASEPICEEEDIPWIRMRNN